MDWLTDKKDCGGMRLVLLRHTDAGQACTFKDILAVVNRRQHCGNVAVEDAILTLAQEHGRIQRIFDGPMLLRRGLADRQTGPRPQVLDWMD
eukprot:scaffold973_cov399-Prasinococcus_capsulatus_cf.AAC.16